MHQNYLGTYSKCFSASLCFFHHPNFFEYNLESKSCEFRGQNNFPDDSDITILINITLHSDNIIANEVYLRPDHC